MVDVGGKTVQVRTATAAGRLVCRPETIYQLREMALPKGDVLAVARIAGILAAKRCDELIPLCHSLPLEKISIEFTVGERSIDVLGTASTSAKTGVEMEALMAVSVAALTLYDMMKAVDKSMTIEGIHVVKKTKE